MLSNRVQAIPLTWIAAPFTGAWQEVNAGVPYPLFLLRIINGSSVAIQISYDRGVTPHDLLRAGDSLNLNFQANAQQDYAPANLGKGTPIHILGVGGAGSVFVAGYTYHRE